MSVKAKKYTYKNSLLLFSLLFVQFISYAAPGDLDPTFGTNGLVTTSIGRLDYITSTTLQPDSKIVVSGVVTTNAAIKLAAARYNTDGTLDTTFNSTGIQTILIGSQTEGNSVAIQADNKIIIGGFSSNSQTDLTLVRYNTNGTLDLTFNGTGFNTTSVGMGATINAIKIQSDGSILVGGNAVAGVPQFMLAKYNSTGTLDTSFGSSGIVLTQIGLLAELEDIVLQNDGKIIAVGYANGGVMYDTVAARYNADGSLDGSFGSSGIIGTAIGSESGAYGVALQNDGKIVVAGYTIDNNVYKFALARYNTDGSLDGTFGTGGIVITQIQHCARANAVAIQSDGKIIAAGYSLGDVSMQFALARYDSSGSLDASFGTGGIVVTTIGAPVDSDSQVNGIAIQSDGKIVAAGFSDKDFALARYEG